MRCANCKFWGWPNRAYEVDARPCQIFSDRLDGQHNPNRRTGTDGAFLTSPEATGGEFLTRPLFSCIHWEAKDSAKPWERSAYQDAYASAKEQNGFRTSAAERVREIFQRHSPPVAVKEEPPHESHVVGTESYEPELKQTLEQDGVSGYRTGQWR